MNDFIHTKNKHLALDEMEYFVSDCIIYKVYFEMDISICLFIFVWNPCFILHLCAIWLGLIYGGNIMFAPPPCFTMPIAV